MLELHLAYVFLSGQQINFFVVKCIVDAITHDKGDRVLEAVINAWWIV